MTAAGAHRDAGRTSTTRDPQQPERARDQKPDAPAVTSRDRNDQEWRDEGSNHRRAVEDADRQRPLAHWKPLRDDLVAAGVIRALAGAEPETKQAEAPERARHRVHRIPQRPPDDRRGQADPDADPIHQPAHRKLADHHPELEPGHDGAVLGVGKMERVPDDRGENRERLPIDEIDDRDAEKERQDHPAHVPRRRRGLRRLECGAGSLAHACTPVTSRTSPRRLLVESLRRCMAGGDHTHRRGGAQPVAAASVAAQRLERLDAGCAECRQRARDQGDGAEQQRHARESDRIGR